MMLRRTGESTVAAVEWLHPTRGWAFTQNHCFTPRVLVLVGVINNCQDLIFNTPIKTQTSIIVANMQAFCRSQEAKINAVSITQWSLKHFASFKRSQNWIGFEPGGQSEDCSRRKPAPLASLCAKKDLKSCRAIYILAAKHNPRNS